jgi:AcrR family transcriptional regulator
MAAGRKTGKKQKKRSTSGKTTRERMLDIAELLFAEHGYEGVSLREIARQGDIDLSLLKYHFGDKLRLFEEVLTRRVEAVRNYRLEALEAARARCGSTPPPIEDVVDAFMHPFLMLSTQRDHGWKTYMQLVAKISIHPHWTAVLSKLFDPTARHFLSAMRMALPQASDQQVHWAYQFMLANMVFVFAETGRIDLLSDEQYRSSDLETAYEHMLRYVVGGIKACTAPSES